MKDKKIELVIMELILATVALLFLILYIFIFNDSLILYYMSLLVFSIVIISKLWPIAKEHMKAMSYIDELNIGLFKNEK